MLITGLSGVGKTTLIKNLSEELKDFRPVGFYTTEIREKGIRKGFELISLDGIKGILSHVDIKSHYKVGKYSVNIEGFETFLESIPFFNSATSLIIIDEIGKMECFSSKFRKLIKEILNSEKVLIATIALKGEGFIREIKNRNDIKSFEITQGNRDYLLLVEVLKVVKILLARRDTG
ncbi:MAG: NTPase [Nitrospira sp.]|nr:NTPase [Nitrospira sp.]